MFGQLFFSLFSTLIFFGFYVFFQFFFMYFITSKIIFSKFGMYLTYKNRFWGHFSWFLGRDINSTVWTRIGSKIKKRVMVFKGLIFQMPTNIYDLMPVLMCGMSWILCTLVSPNSWDHSDGLASARKLHVVTCNFFRALWFKPISEKMTSQPTFFATYTSPKM